MNALILNWQQCYQSGATKCGGKGWNLARLSRYGFAVPSGAVVVADLYKQVMAKKSIAGLINSCVALSADKVLEPQAITLLDAIQKGIRSTGLPDSFDSELQQFLDQYQFNNAKLAVRSSATQEDGVATSFAGIHETGLNVTGFANIKRSILDCFASLWTPRAVSYRRKMRVSDKDIACAVVIMKLVEAESSGVAFSCDPLSGREDVIVINANFAYGESIVSGHSDPDMYHLHSHGQSLIKCHIGKKQIVTSLLAAGGTQQVKSDRDAIEQVLRLEKMQILARLVARIYYALGDQRKHQDIEWVYDGKDFYIVQARPVTSIPRLTVKEFSGIADIWSNGNFRDAAPMVLSELQISLSLDYINPILRTAFSVTGYTLPAGLNFCKLFEGRAYINASLLQWLFFDCFGVPPEVTNKNLGGHQSVISVDDPKYKGVRKRLSRAWRLARLIFKIIVIKRKSVKRYADEVQFAKSIMKRNLQSLGDHELIDLLQTVDRRINKISEMFILLSMTSGSYTSLVEKLERYFPSEGAMIANALLIGQADMTSANQGYRLVQLSTLVGQDSAASRFFSSADFCPDSWDRTLPDTSVFKQKFKEYIADYGHRGVYEMDITNPRWNEDPTYLLNVIKNNLGKVTFNEFKKSQVQKASAAWKKINNKVPFYLRPFIKMMVKQAAQGAAAKELSKSVYVQLHEPMRRLLLEAGHRLVKKGVLNAHKDIFHCAFIEVVAVLSNEWSGDGLELLVAKRQQAKLFNQQRDTPDTIVDDVAHYYVSENEKSSQTLIGVGAAAGCAEGNACIIHSPDEGVMTKPGDILVAPSTDPAWTPLFLNASAIVMETGGQLSHGSIVAREYGIPAVVNIRGVLKTLTNGERLIVDGDKGIVKRLDSTV